MAAKPKPPAGASRPYLPGVFVTQADFSPPVRLQAYVIGKPGAWPALKVAADQLGSCRGHRAPPAPSEVQQRRDQDGDFAAVFDSIVTERGWKARLPNPAPLNP